jgi:fucose 4-O-acetylase-like acetyltransferase
MVPMGNPGVPMQAMPMGGTGPKGQTRNPMMVLLISMVCFLYGIYQYYVMVGELKEYLQTDEINPIHMFIPVLNILMLFKLPGWVLQAKQRAGVPNPEVANILFYWFFGLYFLPKDLNEVWNPTGQLPA